MEALWKLEDKLKLTTKQAVVILVVTASAVTLLCAIAAFLNRNSRGKQVANAEWDSETEVESITMEEERRSCKWSNLKKRLMGSFCWSSATKWLEMETPRTFLAVKERSLNAVDPVWQRPILMGEKCELPRFSGLILYDERGHPVYDDPQPQEQVEQSTVVRTTLRDLL